MKGPEPAPSPEVPWYGNHHAAHRALEIMVAGGHHTLLLGPPGAGQSALARKIHRLLGPCTPEELREFAPAYLLPDIPDAQERPFIWAAPDLTPAALLGTPARPGEAPRAHLGVLVLDDLATFPRQTLEALSRVMDEGAVKLEESGQGATLPAEFTLLATMALLDDGSNRFDLRPLRLLPLPLLDQFHILMEVERQPLWCDPGVEFAEVRLRLERARTIQTHRFSGPKRNAAMSEEEVERFCRLGAKGKKLLERGKSMIDLSPRGIRQVHTMARTIADLAGGGEIQAAQLGEALQYQTLRIGMRKGLAPGGGQASLKREFGRSMRA